MSGRVARCDAIARRIASGEWSPERGGFEILYLVHDEELAAQERMAAAILNRRKEAA
jgi:hypothetical protein